MANMAEPQADAYTLLEESFPASPKLRHHKHMPRRSDDYRNFSQAAAPLRRDYSYTATDDGADSEASSQPPSPIASPGALNGTDNGLPPTPPTVSQDGTSAQERDPLPHADGVVSSLMSKKSSLSTPVNARSPPTPDPSPPRTNEPSNVVTERPPIFAYPSSRAESFKTAREDAFSSDSRSITPVGDRLSIVEEDRGLGLAFEHDEDDITPTNRAQPFFAHAEEDTMVGAAEDKGVPVTDVIPDREWNTDLMRNVTIRRKRKPNSSPQKDIQPVVATVETISPSPSTRARRTSSLRERVEASSNSPHTPSIDNFAQSIGWPSEGKEMPKEAHSDETNKRMSTSSVTSTVVSAMVIVTPPRRRQTLRHSGKNMAYRRDISSPADLGSTTHSNRNSMHSDDVPLHRLIHKRTSVAERKKRISSESDTLGSVRTFSPASMSSRTIDSSAHTLAHQESIRRVLQPAADILSRHNSVSQPPVSGSSYRKRISSAPEPTRQMMASPGPRNFSQISPPESPRHSQTIHSHVPAVERTSTPISSSKPALTSPASRKERPQPRVAPDSQHSANVNKSLPDLPIELTTENPPPDVFIDQSEPANEIRPPSALMERVRRLVAEREAAEEGTLYAESKESPATAEHLHKFSPFQDSTPPMRRGSRSSRGRSGERRRSSLSRDRSSLSPDTIIRPSLDRMSTEEIARRSHEWRRPSEEHGRVSFDTSTIRTEEHAMARHLYAQTTPFSQFSDTLEVSEATTVSIFPHNNHSLLIVQQVSRGNSMFPEQQQLTNGVYLTPQDHRDLQPTPTPPFVDASENHEEFHDLPPQPTLNFEPSTPPMQITLSQPGGVVDSPLKNPRPPPEPPKFLFIPPTPAEELERQLVPGPPKRSDSHPQRRLSLVQRARRYSDNLITPLLARASSNRGRHASDPQAHTHRHPRVPTVNDGDGTLHPFWRPRGFWDDFDATDSESDEEGLPTGGDTSDVEEPVPRPPKEPKRTNTLGRKLTSGFRGSGGFLIGNSLGVERHGTNKRRHHVTLPPHFLKSPHTSTHTSKPKIMVQAPTMPIGRNGVSKRGSRNSLRSNLSYELPRRNASWRQKRSLPILKKYELHYIGVSGVRDRFKERNAEKRRVKLKQSIGLTIPTDAPVGTAASL